MKTMVMLAALLLLSGMTALDAAPVVSGGLALPAGQPVANPASGAQTSSAITVGSSLDDIRVYPNPWRADKHKGKPVTFDHVPPAATIKLFTVTGQFVKTLDVDDNGVATWNISNDSGDKVASGLYLYLVSSEDGQDTKGKLAVIQ